MDNDLSAQTGGGDAGAACMAQLRVLAQLQSRLHPQPLPALAAWLGARAGPVLATGRNRERRAGVEERLQALTQAGYLAPMLQALEDPAGRSADAAGGARGGAGAGANRRGTGADRRRCAGPGGRGGTPWPGDRRRLRACRSGHRARRGGAGLRSAMAKRKTADKRRHRREAAATFADLAAGSAVRRDGDARHADSTAARCACSARRCWRLRWIASPGGRARAASLCAAWRRRSFRCGRCGRPATAWPRRPPCWAICRWWRRHGAPRPAGWLLAEAMPIAVRAALEALSITRAARLRAERARLVEAWGLESPPADQ